MAFRYKLRALTAQDDAAQLLEEIFPATNGFGRALAGADLVLPWGQVLGLLNFLDAKCLLIQAGVRDPDFLEEHQAFYAKQHRPVSRKCVRLHAFALEVAIPERQDEKAILDFLAQAANQPDSYLGFTTVRPLRHAPVGATIISPPPRRCPTAFDTFPVHIAGLQFEVTGTPFLQQDNAVGACAQASIWMALRTLRRRQGNAAYSPAELTVAATRYLATDRTFPGRSGLTIEQMLEAIRFAGHDPLHLSIRDPSNGFAQADEILRSAVPYIESGLPVIVALAHPDGGHAVVAIGRQSSRNQIYSNPVTHTQDQGKTSVSYWPASHWVAGLCIHNDNTGPYQKLEPGGTNYYRLEHTTSLIVPLPDGIFTTASEAELLAVRALVRASVLFSLATSEAPSLPELPFVLRTILCARHPFRQWAKDDTNLDDTVRNRYRTHELPLYMWVVEIHDATKYDPTDADSCSRCGEIVLDAAADPFHADALIFARVTHHLWPASQGLAGLLLSEDEEGLEAISTATGKCGRALNKPW